MDPIEAAYALGVVGEGAHPPPPLGISTDGLRRSTGVSGLGGSGFEAEGPWFWGSEHSTPGSVIDGCLPLQCHAT